MMENTHDSIAAASARRKQKGWIAVSLAVCMFLVSLVVAFLVFKNIFSYELKHAFTADSPLYWTVGRGILNGLKPYLDLYENKPVGIFLISALSFRLTGETILCNVISCMAVVMIGVLPALILLDQYRKDDRISGFRKTAVLLTVLLSSLFVAVYTELRSGGFQVEAIGAAFSVLFICLVMKLRGVKSRRERIITTVCASLAIGCAVMFKEPFLLVSVFGALLFVGSFKEMLRNLVIPCVGGAIFVVLGLGVSGVLVPYFSIYFRRMFETRLSGEKASFTKMIEISRLVNDVKLFSVWLLCLLSAAILFALFSAVCKKKSVPGILFHIFKVAAAVFAAQLSVGVGGYYYFHHFVFAVPVYCALLICAGEFLLELTPKKTAVSAAVFLLWGVVLTAVIPNIGNQYWGDYTERYQTLATKAAYVDSLLNYYGEERYQFIGFNGEDVFIGLTKHSPQGPVFGQDSDNFQSEDTWFSQKLIEQVDNSNIVIVKEFLSPAINEQLKNTLSTDFTQQPAVRFGMTVPEGFNFMVYYRISKYGQLS